MSAVGRVGAGLVLLVMWGLGVFQSVTVWFLMPATMDTRRALRVTSGCMGSWRWSHLWRCGASRSCSFSRRIGYEPAAGRVSRHGRGSEDRGEAVVSPVAWTLVGFGVYVVVILLLALAAPQDKRDRWPGGEIR